MATIATNRLLTDYQGGLVYTNYQFIRTQQRSRHKGGATTLTIFWLCRHYLTSINQTRRGDTYGELSSML